MMTIVNTKISPVKRKYMKKNKKSKKSHTYTPERVQLSLNNLSSDNISLNNEFDNEMNILDENSSSYDSSDDISVESSSPLDNLMKMDSLSDETKIVTCIECPVCYDTIHDNNYIITKCNHKFCTDCLFNSLNNKSCCPICRQEIFSFDKNISDLTTEAVNHLECDIEEFKNQMLYKLIFELKNVTKKQIVNSLNTKDNEKNEIIDLIHNEEFNKKINYGYFKLIKNVLNITSLTCYENLHNWLKNN